jgi:adenylate cyclase
MEQDAESGVGAASGSQTFLFADLSGFTALTEAHGDVQAAEMAAEFVEDAETAIAACDAELVKTIGDAVMIRCEDAAEAVRVGLRIACRVGERAGFPSVRVGMHTGAAVNRNGDWFGNTVNVAARVTGAASGGQVLLTSATRDAAGSISGVTLHQRGRRSLRNVSKPVMLYAAVRQGSSERALLIDPVCQMAVDPAHAAGELVHEGRAYHFCSLDCAAKFASDPATYADGTATS